VTYSIDYAALAPEIILALTVMGVLTVDVLVPRRLKYWSAVVALGGMLLSAAAILMLFLDGSGASMFDGSYVVDNFSLTFKALFLAAGYVVLLMSVGYIESDRYYQGEYYFLLVSSILGSLVMSSARGFIVMFIGLELVTAPLFMLAGWRKGDKRSNEAALKYFLLGVLSAAILGWGMSFVFGLTGEVRFDAVAQGMAQAIGDSATRPAAIVAILFVIAGFGFKISAVPFHFWAPDTYEGAPTPVTAYLAVSSKAAGFVGLIVVVYRAFGAVGEIWGPALWLMAAVSMTVGNLTALNQKNIIRMLAYSSVAQGGFMLVPFAAAAASDGAIAPAAVSATVVYLAIYLFMNLGAFAFILAASKHTKSGDIESYAGLSTRAPGLAVLGVVFFFSLAGIPPLAGWFAKFVMFSTAIGAKNTWGWTLGVIAAVNAVIAFYYYARVVKAMWFDAASSEVESEAVVGGSLKLALALCTVAVFVLGVLPGLASTIGDTAAQLLGG
jgi:NADH-quinone oxidoreductase subunit N